jgi:HK97 family phage portal protein
MKKELTELYSGLQNGNGKPILLEMVKAQELSKSPKDADFSLSSAEQQKSIFRVLNIPPILLNIGGDTTFNNQKEAQLWFWDNMVIPMTQDFVMELNRNVTPRYRDPSIFIEADYSEIPALEPRRTQLWERANAADFITLNEKRAMVGMPPTEGGDVILVPSAEIPLSMASFTPPE